MVTKDHQHAFVGERFQALEFGGNGAHGDQLGAFDAGGLEFDGFADVDEDELLAGVQAELHFLRRDFEGQRGGQD